MGATWLRCQEHSSYPRTFRRSTSVCGGEARSSQATVRLTRSSWRPMTVASCGSTTFSLSVWTYKNRAPWTHNSPKHVCCFRLLWPPSLRIAPLSRDASTPRKSGSDRRFTSTEIFFLADCFEYGCNDTLGTITLMGSVLYPIKLEYKQLTGDGYVSLRSKLFILIVSACSDIGGCCCNWVILMSSILVLKRHISSIRFRTRGTLPIGQTLLWRKKS